MEPVGILSFTGLLVGCATANPAWTVKSEDQAIAIAARDCGTSSEKYSGKWQAELQGDHWFVWKSPTAGLQDRIDAVNGKPEGCVIVTRNSN